jgi:hypothetical protein
LCPLHRFHFTTPCDWNGNGVIDAPYTLQGQQCLVLWTGGIPTYSEFSTAAASFAQSGAILRKNGWATV